jgi:hypothetical protein
MATEVRNWCYSCSSEQNVSSDVGLCPSCNSDFLEVLPDRPAEPEGPPITIIPISALLGPESPFDRLRVTLQQAQEQSNRIPALLEMLRDIASVEQLLSGGSIPNGHGSAPPATQN